MLALSYLLMIGMTLIADGFGVHVPKGYIYAAMLFSAGVEALNTMARARRKRGRIRPAGGFRSPPFGLRRNVDDIGLHWRSRTARTPSPGPR